MIIRALLLVLALTVPPALAAEGTGQPLPTAQLFAQQFPLTRGILAADFPQDLTALEQSFETIDGSEISPQIKLQRAFLDLTALRKKYAPKLQFARRDLSALMVLSLAGFYDAVLRRDGTQVCGGFAVDGAATLFTIGQGNAYALEMDRQAGAYFSAVASALEDPDVVERANDADWATVMGQVVADGNPPGFVASIAAGKAADPTLCPAVSALLHAMVEVKSAAGDRVRAEFIQGATGY